MPFTRFDRYVERNARSFVERLQSLCRMPSVAARGTGMRAMAEAVEQMLQRVGGGTRQYRIGSGFPIVYAECGAGDRCLVVYGHYDVAPVGPLTEWGSGPFAAALEGERVVARGATSKGALVARVAAIEAFQKTFGKLPVCVRFVVEGEDGLGSPSLYGFSARHGELLVADGSYWDDGYRDSKGRLVVNLGFKGIVVVELRVHGPRTDLHSKWSPIVPNPAWRLVQALATMASPRGVITIDGLMSHVAPLSAEDRQLLKTVELDEAGLRREFKVGAWARGLTGRELTKELIFGPTCNISGVRTGHNEAGAKTVLPGSATARLDFRLVPDLSPELILKLLREHLDARGFADVEIVELGATAFAKSSPKSFVARAAVESAAEVYGAAPVVYPLDPASGAVSAVCGVQYPPTPVASFGVGYFGSNPHGPNENVRVEDFIAGVKYFGRVLQRFAQLEDDRSARREGEKPLQLSS
ncbi:MAG TPA: M20/M25/M40 family metallo-hydrolase [Pyrinomonadaceae bacterium]|nr:M20/M25/M40 family metallo-hydrolase [Pyrinomonadaceae bacterium]